jgi:hypothetical protein
LLGYRIHRARRLFLTLLGFLSFASLDYSLLLASDQWVLAAY